MPKKSGVFPVPGSKEELEEGEAFTPRFDADGLIPAIVTDSGTGDVLMFAFMNAEALSATIETREAHFYSRSRGKLWRKGEDSEDRIKVESLRTDCDQDVVWLKVGIGGHRAACHTGRKTCFYREVRVDGPGGAGTSLTKIVRDKSFSPAEVYGKKRD